ncbi:hypothetical protein ACPX19_04500 [Winogradskyella sp. HB-48]|uniref:hypothetical protein n=1 Tax=Winogradskyella sp. HB-48 TaxID=3416808 RepID=UPI003CF66AC8
MSRLITILFSGLILIQSFQIGMEDLMQLDELFEHAQFHKQEYGDNFFVFLSKHYGGLKAEHSTNHKEEQSDHEKLPFQCQGHSLVILAVLESTEFEASNQVDAPVGSKAVFHYSNLYSLLNKEELLQPPRNT